MQYFSAGKERMILEPLKGYVNAFSIALAYPAKAPLTEPKLIPKKPSEKHSYQKEKLMT
jgi:hypothetical protein